ncbi:MAG: aminotransferase class I/II-fold pyridoxal phosphate-dependent enzyme [Pseudomonadota bacterium]
MGLTNEARQAALDLARRGRRMAAQTESAAAPTTRGEAPQNAMSAEARPPRRARPFSALREHQELAAMRAFAEAAEIETPFFRLHEGRSGARARIGGREVLNFASYDYLGLNGDPRVRDAAKQAIDLYGVSACASRPTAGERPVHQALETALARFFGLPAALTFVSGHATNVSTIGTLVGPRDLLLTDQLCHNSIITGATLSGAARRVFPHNDLAALRDMLERDRDAFENALIVVEGVYSMDGDHPDLPGLLALKEEFGAWLMVDEAHALGVLGARGRGLAEHFDVDPNMVDIWMGTLGKTLAGCGGYIAGSEALIDILKHHAPGFVYSVAAPPAVAAASLAALEILEAEPERVARIQEAGRALLEGCRDRGLDTGISFGEAVVPVMTGGSVKAIGLARALLSLGVNAAPIIHPAVPEQAARVRFFVSSEHSLTEIDEALDALSEAAQTLR